MKATSGKPYTKPTTQPTEVYGNGSGILIEVYKYQQNVEVYQTDTAGHESRLAMTHAEFGNFMSLLTSTGYQLQ